MASITVGTSISVSVSDCVRNLRYVCSRLQRGWCHRIRNEPMKQQLMNC